MTPMQLKQLIEESVSGGYRVDERATEVSFNCFLTAEICQKWLAVSRKKPEFVSSITIREEDSDEYITDVSDLDESVLMQIVIKKITVQDGALILFSQSVMQREIIENFPILFFADLAENCTFSTFYNTFMSCAASAFQEVKEKSFGIEKIDPRTFCLDLTNENFIPQDLRPYIIKNTPSEESDVYKSFLKLAGSYLLASLSESVGYDEKNSLVVSYSGPPRRRVEFERLYVGCNDLDIQTAAKWVFIDSTHDNELRHMIIAGEIARVYHSKDRLSVSHALDSAKATYNAHVKAGSKEVLKLLSDIRSDIIDDIHKINEKSSELLNAIWRSALFAITPFAIRAVSAPSDEKAEFLYGSVSIFFSIFIGLSFIAQTKVHKNFLSGVQNSVYSWGEAVRGILSDDEILEIAKNPVSESLERYSSTWRWVMAVYLLLCAFLMYSGLESLSLLTF